MKRLFLLLFIFVCLVTPIAAQQVQMAPLSVTGSTLINDLKAIKAANPKISPEEFAKSANTLLAKQGINYIFGFDAALCQKLDDARKQKDPNAPLHLRATLKSVNGDPTTLSLPEAVSGKNECFPCFVSLPTLEITDKDFVTIVEGQNIKFELPQSFQVNEVALVDSKDLTIIKRRWKIPFHTTPLFVSEDDNIIYLGLDDPVLTDLSLMIFGEGVAQFATKTEIKHVKSSPFNKDVPKDPSMSNMSFIKFEDGQTAKIVRLVGNCGN